MWYICCNQFAHSSDTSSWVQFCLINRIGEFTPNGKLDRSVKLDRSEQIEHNSQRRRLQILNEGAIEPDRKSNLEIWKDEEIFREKHHLTQHCNWLSQNNIQITPAIF